MRFEYLEPTSIQEAIALFERYDGKAMVMAGGTDLLVQMRKKTIRPGYVIHIGNIRGLDDIRYDKQEGLKIDALTTIRALGKSSEVQGRYPVISQAAGQLGSIAVRNMATLGGNLCNAAPSAETAPALIALSARARIVGPEGERLVLVEDFFTGPGSSILGKGEILTEIQVPVPKPHTGAGYFSHSMRGTIDLAIVGVSALITLKPREEVCEEVKVVLAAVAPASYRREMVKVFTQRAIKEAFRLARTASASSML